MGHLLTLRKGIVVLSWSRRAVLGVNSHYRDLGGVALTQDRNLHYSNLSRKLWLSNTVFDLSKPDDGLCSGKLVLFAVREAHQDLYADICQE